MMKNTQINRNTDIAARWPLLSIRNNLFVFCSRLVCWTNDQQQSWSDRSSVIVFLVITPTTWCCRGCSVSRATDVLSALPAAKRSACLPAKQQLVTCRIRTQEMWTLPEPPWRCSRTSHLFNNWLFVRSNCFLTAIDDVSVTDTYCYHLITQAKLTLYKNWPSNFGLQARL